MATAESGESEPGLIFRDFYSSTVHEHNVYGIPVLLSFHIIHCSIKKCEHLNTVLDRTFSTPQLCRSDS